MSKSAEENTWKSKIILVVGHETPSPTFKYQTYQGRSGQISAEKRAPDGQTFESLRNLKI